MKQWFLIILLAITLQGEAGILGTKGMYQVADTILARLASPDYPNTLENVLEVYYARAEPSEEAIGLAACAILSPWTPGPFFYAYGDGDVSRFGWRQGDEVLCGHGFCLHLAREWPGR